MENLEQERSGKQVTNCNHSKNSQRKTCWRSRAATHYENILEILRERGPHGVTSAELYSDASRFGRSPRNRVSELRQHGHNIKTIFLSRDMVCYVLQEAPRPAVVPRESTTDDLPLFAGAES